MAKKPGTNPKNEFVFFDVVYEDGSQRSNRRVPAELLGGFDKDGPARGFIIEQDRDIAEKSGRPPLSIKSIRRTVAARSGSLTGAVIRDRRALIARSYARQTHWPAAYLPKITRDEP